MKSIVQHFHEGWEAHRGWAGRLTRSIFARQVGTTALTQALSVLLSLAITAITAKWLGPAGKGQLALIFMVPALFQLILGAGLGPANVYYAGSNRLPVNQLSANAVAFSLIGTAVGFVILVAVLLYDLQEVLLPGIAASYLLAGMLALPLGLLSDSFNSLLHGLQRIYTMNLLSIGRTLLSVALMAVLIIALGMGLWGAVAATLVVQAATLMAIAMCLRKEGVQFRPRWNLRILKPTLSFGLKCYLGNLLQFFSYRLDMFIVNFFLGPTSVGIYGVAVAMAELLWQLPNAASFVIFPKSSNSSQEVMNRFTPRVFGIIMALGLLGAIGLALLGKSVIRIVFSPEFDDAYTPLVVLLPGVVLLGAGKILSNDIAGRGFPQYNAISSGLSLVITIALDLVLIPAIGLVGAALASTASYILTFLLSAWFYRKVSQNGMRGLR